MDTENDIPAPEGGTPRLDHQRPLDAWLRLVDALITHEFTAAFDGEDISRRDWMLLNTLAGGTAVPWMTARLTHGGKRPQRLADRGWVTQADDGTWTLTDDGRAARERLSALVAGVRAKVTGAVTPDEFAALTASLEAIARALGWDESQPMPPRGGKRGHRRGHDGCRKGRTGFPPGAGPWPTPWLAFGGPHGFAGGFGSGRPGAGWPHPPCEHGDTRAHGHHHAHADRHDAWHEGAHDAWHAGAHDAWHAAGHGRGTGERPGRAHSERPEHGRGHEGDHGHRGADEYGRASGYERAYERGFAAGFRAGHGGDAEPDASSAPEA